MLFIMSWRTDKWRSKLGPTNRCLRSIWLSHSSFPPHHRTV